MAVTLIESAKYHASQGNAFRSGVIELFARNSEILSVLPFTNINGNALAFSQEATSPAAAFRGVNAAYTEGSGVVNPMVEKLFIAGGDLDVDKFLIQTQGNEVRAQQEAMKIRALARLVSKTVLKGSNATAGTSFDGLQLRCVGDQLIYAGTTDGGDALALSKLDQAIHQTENPTHIIMGYPLIRRLSAAQRSASVGGYVTFQPDEFGRQVMFYNGLRVIAAGYDETGAEILQHNEVGYTGSTATAGSLYVCSIGDMGFTGIQNGDINAIDLGEQNSKPVLRTRVEWYMGIALMHPRSVTRLAGITNAAITA